MTNTFLTNTFLDLGGGSYVESWIAIAWFAATILLCTVSYFLGCWRGWRSTPIELCRIAKCELSAQTGYAKARGCPFREPFPAPTPRASAGRLPAEAAEHARRNEECAAMLNKDIERREREGRT